MNGVSLGPLVVPANLLALVVAAIVAAVVGRWVGRLHRTSITGVLVDMFAAALVTARLVFVVLWSDRYRDSLWGWLDIRDGGFTAWAGVVSAALVGAWQAWRQPLLRKPLLYGLFSGVAIWLLSPGLLQVGSGTPLSALASTPLRTLSGAPAALAGSVPAKPTVINLWATWCPPCRREMPVLAAAQKERGDIRFVFANQGEDAATVRAYLDPEKPSPDSVVLDPTGAIARKVGSFGLPTTLFFDAQGRLVATHVGVLSSASLAATLADIVPARR